MATNISNEFVLDVVLATMGGIWANVVVVVLMVIMDFVVINAEMAGDSWRTKNIVVMEDKVIGHQAIDGPSYNCFFYNIDIISIYYSSINLAEK